MLLLVCHHLADFLAEHPFDFILESLLAGGAEMHPDDVGHFPDLLNQSGRIVLDGGVLDGRDVAGVGSCVLRFRSP